jgi:hypothetical protein
MWDSRYCYWETWAIHRESPYLKFFSEKYGDLVLWFVGNQKPMSQFKSQFKHKYEDIMNSRSMKMTAPLRKIMGMVRKFNQ